MLRQVEIVKKYKYGYMCWYIAHAPYTRECLNMYRLNMIFVVHEPMGFERKLSPNLSFLIRNYVFDMLIIAKTIGHGTFCFGQKWSSEPWFSNRKYKSGKHFLSKAERLGDNFCTKQKSAVPWTHRNLASDATLQKSMTLSL